MSDAPNAIDMVATAVMTAVMRNRQSLLLAYVAETGLYPTDCTLVEQPRMVEGEGRACLVQVVRVVKSSNAQSNLLPRFTPRETCCQSGEAAHLELCIPTIEEGAELIRLISRAMQEIARHPDEPSAVGLRGCLLR